MAGKPVTALSLENVCDGYVVIERHTDASIGFDSRIVSRESRRSIENSERSLDASRRRRRLSKTNPSRNRALAGNGSTRFEERSNDTGARV